MKLKEIETILSSKLNVRHFIFSLFLTIGVSIGFYILIFIFAWLNFSESSASSRMFSGTTIFMTFTVELLILVFVLYLLYANAKSKQNLSECKSYLALAVIVFLEYSMALFYSFSIYG